MTSADVADAASNEEGGGILTHIPAILWQRRWLVIIPLIAIGIAGFVASFFVPTVYQSSAVFLVETQELPKDIVSSPTTSLIDARVDRLKQQMLSRAELTRLIYENDLYPDERRRQPFSDIIELMRDATRLEAISAEGGQQQNGTSTVAFSLSFEYESPAKTYAVMQDYVRRFLELAAVQTLEQAQSTVSFLSAQALDLQKQVAEVENQITDIKARNGAALAAAGLASPAGSTGNYDAQIAALQRENSALAQQAATRPPEPRDPTVVAAEAQLAGAQAVYSDNHPDVRIARQRLEEARRLAAANQTPPAPSSIPTQIAANNAQIAALGRARSQETARMSSVSSAQARAPVVLEQIAQLESRADDLREQYQVTSTRLLNAQNSARMEEQQKGERLSLTEPPALPDDPISPSALVVTIGGISLGALAGLALALLVELLYKPIRGVSQVESLLGAPPLVVIPTLQMGEDVGRFAWLKRLSQRFGSRSAVRT